MVAALVVHAGLSLTDIKNLTVLEMNAIFKAISNRG
jgi:hypothetical protein